MSVEQASRQQLHRFVRDLALRTGELLLARYGLPGKVTEKAPKDIVTETDLLCEDFLVGEIRERYPDDAILSEELGGEISESGRTWLLDPLDGTANYSRANPLFCSCISVVEGGRTTHATVVVPLLRHLYHAVLEGGAFVETPRGGEPLRVSTTRRLEDAFVGADNSLRGEKKGLGRGLDGVFASCWQLRSLGSAGIRGAWVAAGHLDVSIGLTNTPWDYAPVSLLASEAGGTATDPFGQPWTFGSDGLVTTNGLLHDEVLALIDGERPKPA